MKMKCEYVYQINKNTFFIAYLRYQSQLALQFYLHKDYKEFCVPLTTI